jgi:hypothetical protein
MIWVHVQTVKRLIRELENVTRHNPHSYTPSSLSSPCLKTIKINTWMMGEKGLMESTSTRFFSYGCWLGCFAEVMFSTGPAKHMSVSTVRPQNQGGCHRRSTTKLVRSQQPRHQSTDSQNPLFNPHIVNSDKFLNQKPTLQICLHSSGAETESLYTHPTQPNSIQKKNKNPARICVCINKNHNYTHETCMNHVCMITQQYRLLEENQ